MAANVLRSERAVQMSVFVVRAFVRLREQVAANTAVLRRLTEIDENPAPTRCALRDVYQKLLPLIQPSPDPPKRRIGFRGQRLVASAPIADAAARMAALDHGARSSSGPPRVGQDRAPGAALHRAPQDRAEARGDRRHHFHDQGGGRNEKRVLDSLQNPGEIAHRLRIQTIDAFCASLTRQMPVVSGFGAQPGIIEDAEEHYRQAALRTVNELSPAACRLLLHLDNNLDTATSMIASMLAKRDQWLRKTGSAPTRAELEANLQRERERILAHARTLHPKASIDFAAAALTQNRTWRVRGRPVPLAQQAEPLRQALEELLRMPEERYTDEQWQTLGAILELLPRRRAAQGGVRRARRDRLHRGRARRGAPSARPTTRPTFCSRSTRGSGTYWSTSSRTPRTRNSN